MYVNNAIPFFFQATMTENWDEPVAVAEVPEILLFGRWSSDDVQVSDISLTVSINLNFFHKNVSIS